MPRLARSAQALFLIASTLAATAGSPSRASAQQLPAALDSSLHRIFASRYYASGRFGPARWLDGSSYTTVESNDSVPHGSDIVRYDAATGARSVLVPARELVPQGDSTALGFDDYAWSPDHSKLLLFTNTERVWRRNTRGDYWVLDRKAHKLTKLGGPDAEPSTLMYAKFSPQGDRVAYVRKGDIYVENLADHHITRLTTGADSLHVNGMTDWVYEEELDLRDAFRWSPDGQKIAFWHFDMTGVGTFLLINDTDSLYPFTIPIQYPKAGTTNSAVTAGVVSAAGGPVTWLKIPGDPRNDYLPRMEWAGADTLILQRLNRPQNTDVVMLASAATGETHPILTERDSAWLDVVDTMPFIDHGKSFLWESERDGWRHVYRVSKDGKNVKLITPGDFDVIGVAGVDDKGGWLYYYGTPATDGKGTERGREGDGGGAGGEFRPHTVLFPSSVPSGEHPASPLALPPRRPRCSPADHARRQAVHPPLRPGAGRRVRHPLLLVVRQSGEDEPGAAAEAHAAPHAGLQRHAAGPGPGRRSRRRTSSASPSPTAPRSTGG